MSQDSQALALFRAAYENRYTWDEAFPGLTADVAVRIGDRTRTGKCRIAADLSVSVTMDAPELTTRTTKTPEGEEKTVSVDEGQEWLTNQLRDVVTHRKRRSFADAHGKSTFALGETDETGAVEILVSGDAMGSNYKVRDRQIAMVSRVMGRIGFVIHHLASLDTGEGYLSTAYNAVFRNPMTGEVVRQAKFEDTYERVGDYYVMTRQVVHVNEQGQKSTYDIAFTNIRLGGGAG